MVPTWNRVKVLLRAIESVLRQDVGDWELIVVDDGSADQQRVTEAVTRYGDARIRLITLKSNHNAAYARNVGIKASKGKWISFLDSDDYFLPAKLSRVRRELEAIGAGEKAVVYSAFYQRRGDTLSRHPRRGISDGESVGDYIFVHGEAIGTPGVIMSRQFAAEVQFDPTCIKHQDYDLLLRAEQAGARFHYIDEELWTRDFRSSGNNVGARHVPEFACQWLNNHATVLSDRAQLAFIARHIVGRMAAQNRAQTLKDLFGILKAGSWPKKHGVLLLAPLLPYSWFKKILDQQLASIGLNIERG